MPWAMRGCGAWVVVVMVRAKTMVVVVNRGQ